MIKDTAALNFSILTKSFGKWMCLLGLGKSIKFVSSYTGCQQFIKWDYSVKLRNRELNISGSYLSSAVCNFILTSTNRKQTASQNRHDIWIPSETEVSICPVHFLGQYLPNL